MRERSCSKRSAPVPVREDLESAIQLAESSLERRFGDVSTAEQRHQIAIEASEAFAASAVTNYLPILIERRSNQIASERFGAS